MAGQVGQTIYIMGIEVSIRGDPISNKSLAPFQSEPDEEHRIAWPECSHPFLLSAKTRVKIHAPAAPSRHKCGVDDRHIPDERLRHSLCYTFGSKRVFLTLVNLLAQNIGI